MRELGVSPSTDLIRGQGPSYLLGNATILGIPGELVAPRAQAKVIKMAGHFGDSLEVGGTGPGQGNQVVIRRRS